MSGYLLDTDTSIEIMRGRNRAVLERLAAVNRMDVAISAVTVAEILFGAWLSKALEFFQIEVPKQRGFKARRCFG